ncbi:Hypothetical protein CINCED_3A018034 [Cinara cedri]|uniref:Enoyl reductase (ER) domain-containing protein n=1 Tax=Cinara cedri TaxID=506608 RepID=A0A5E4MHK0_9HEMI|nr:Hypothetical protein CINCED_3A018034 [Cinara cedri]
MRFAFIGLFDDHYEYTIQKKKQLEVTMETKMEVTVPEAPRMVAWQMDAYGTYEDLKANDQVPAPTEVGPKEVLVRIKASSVNPIDVLMAEGYGKVFLNRVRQAQQMSLCRPVEFPLTLGRDFCGVVVAKGANVTDALNVGDTVMGVIAPFNQGCHSELVSVPEAQVIKKPENLSDEEAAGLLYTGLTVWCALKLAGGLYVFNAAGKNVLVIGGSGGVGNCAIQLLHCWGAKVTTTCSTNAINLVKGLIPDNIVDYTTEDAHKQLEKYGKYDLILDAAGIPYENIRKYIPLLNIWGAFITLRSPILTNIDLYGLIPGMVKNAYDLVVPNVLSGAVFKGATIRWGAFMPIENGIKELTQLAEEKKIVVPLDSVYNFTNIKNAFKRVKNGHLRGKVIVTCDETKVNVTY